MKAIWGPGWVFVLLIIPACSGKVEDSSTGRPSPFVPAGGSGSTIPPITGSSGSTMSVGEPKPQPDSGGNDGEGGCPAVAYFSGVFIRADAPVSLAAAQLGSFIVCRNDDCYDGRFGNGNAFTIRPKPGNAPDTEITVSLNGDLFLSWIDFDPGGSFEDGDRYRLTFDTGLAGAPFVPIVDTTVVYSVVDHGSCGGLTQNATVDLRGQGGEAGAAGASGDAAGAFGEGGAAGVRF